jgi:hypothetical protein
LRTICHELLVGPARRHDAPLKLDDRFFGHVDCEGTDFSFVQHQHSTGPFRKEDELMTIS